MMEVEDLNRVLAEAAQLPEELSITKKARWVIQKKARRVIQMLYACADSRGIPLVLGPWQKIKDSICGINRWPE